ncbi:hypothetical protein [Haloferax sp. YSSS75]|uniref:hypothetical protein n=1 Tax=Haloferax sp. YSSS75 TaxID=3388564 RepID=UPI00398C9F72
MNRRAYLSAAGLVLFAGCSTSETTETPAPTTTEATTTETPTETTTAAPTTTETPTETTTEEPETETTEEPDRVDRILNLAVADLTDAVTVFEDAAGPDGGFHDVNTATRLDFDTVAEPLYLARGHFNTLGQLEKTQEQESQLTALQGVYWFLWWTAKTYENLGSVRIRTNNAVTRFYDGEYYRIESAVEQISDALESAENTFERILDESNPEQMDAFDVLSPDDYTRKVDDLETELAQFDRFGSLLVSMRSATERLQRGFDEYLDENYEDAMGSFFRASLAFEDVSEALAELDPIESLETYVADFACLSDALAVGSDAMDEAATAGDRDIPEKQPELEDEAQTAFESCELTAERVPMVPAFFEALPDERS